VVYVDTDVSEEPALFIFRLKENAEDDSNRFLRNVAIKLHGITLQKIRLLTGTAVRAQKHDSSHMIKMFVLLLFCAAIPLYFVKQSTVE
jgi:hypothetical protein